MQGYFTIPWRRSSDFEFCESSNLQSGIHMSGTGIGGDGSFRYGDDMIVKFDNSDPVLTSNRYFQIMLQEFAHYFIVNKKHQNPSKVTVSDVRLMNYFKAKLQPIVPKMKIKYRRNDG